MSRYSNPPKPINPDYAEYGTNKFAGAKFRGNNPAITDKQLKWLIREAMSAYGIAEKNGLTDGLDFNSWRHEVMAEEFDNPSFKELRMRHFAKAINLFRSFTGQGPLEYGGRQKTTDDIPARRKALFLLGQSIRDNKFNCAYVYAILHRRFDVTLEEVTDETVTQAVDCLKTPQINQLAWTLNNRARARDGKGDPEQRNKKQRAEREKDRIAAEYDRRRGK